MVAKKVNSKKKSSLPEKKSSAADKKNAASAVVAKAAKPVKPAKSAKSAASAKSVAPIKKKIDKIDKATKPTKPAKPDKNVKTAKVDADVAEKINEQVKVAVETPTEESAPIVSVVPAKVKTSGSRKHKQVEINSGPTVVYGSLPGLRVAPGLISGDARAAKKTKEENTTHKLSKKEFAEIKAKLTAAQDACLAKLSARVKTSDDTHSLSADPVDQASDTCDEDISLEIASAQDEQLQLINSALEKIDNGTYGVCIMCGESIPWSRLQLLPYVLRCKNCREIYEKNRRRSETNWGLINSGLAGDGETEREEVPVEE